MSLKCFSVKASGKSGDGNPSREPLDLNGNPPWSDPWNGREPSNSRLCFGRRCQHRMRVQAWFLGSSNPSGRITGEWHTLCPGPAEIRGPILNGEQEQKSESHLLAKGKSKAASEPKKCLCEPILVEIWVDPAPHQANY
jgi:hypothetical protein